MRCSIFIVLHAPVIDFQFPSHAWGFVSLMADLLQSLVAPPKLDEQTPTSSPTPPDVMETPGHILELWQWVLIGSLVLFAVLAIVPLCITVNKALLTRMWCR